jgi:hypothetical protein
MCDAVVPDVKPLNVTSTRNVLAAGSRTTVAKPVPGVMTGGISAAPVRLASNVIGTASAAGGRSARAEIMIIADTINFIFILPMWYGVRADRCSPSF